MPQTSTRLLACPVCGKLSIWAPDNPWRPFCSERCKHVDLGLWASESYRLIGESTSEPDDTAQ